MTSMKNPFRVDRTAMKIVKEIIANPKGRMNSCCGDIASEIFTDLDKIILSGYPYKRFHPRKYNMLKKKYL